MDIVVVVVVVGCFSRRKPLGSRQSILPPGKRGVVVDELKSLRQSPQLKSVEYRKKIEYRIGGWNISTNGKIWLVPKVGLQEQVFGFWFQIPGTG